MSSQVKSRRLFRVLSGFRIESFGLRIQGYGLEFRVSGFRV